MWKLFFAFIILSQGLFAVEEERLLLITGCARSGTRYAAMLFSACGLDFPHEKMGKDGTSCWAMAVKYKQSPPWGPPVHKYKFQHIFHQVRNPLHTIASVYVCEPQESWNFIYTHIPEISPKDRPWVKCAKYWYYWNLKAEKIADITYRIEDMTVLFGALCERLNITPNGSAIDSIPTNMNHRHQTPQLKWADLRREIPEDLYYKISALAWRYGYPIMD